MVQSGGQPKAKRRTLKHPDCPIDGGGQQESHCRPVALGLTWCRDGNQRSQWQEVHGEAGRWPAGHCADQGKPHIMQTALFTWRVLRLLARSPPPPRVCAAADDDDDDDDDVPGCSWGKRMSTSPLHLKSQPRFIKSTRATLVERRQTSVTTDDWRQVSTTRWQTSFLYLTPSWKVQQPPCQER